MTLELELQRSLQNVLVGICTFNRNDGLKRLLDSLGSHYATHHFRVLVIDNSPTGAAEELVRAEFDWVEYVHEPKPGIVAARNRVLANRRDEWALIFIDDDEFVSNDWYSKLVGHALEGGADVYFAPVLADLPSGTPAWIRNGGFFDRPRYATGREMPFGPTNNVIMNCRIFEEYNRAFFDEAFSESGGSDVDLFWRLKAQGARLEWFDDAVVFEIIPAERLTEQWIRNRFRRLGNNQGLLMRRDMAAGRVLIHGLARVGVGGSRVIFRSVLRRPLRRQDLGLLNIGYGMLGYIFGSRPHEYRRIS